MTIQSEHAAAFRGLCHYSPDTVQTMRAALDVGVKPTVIKQMLRRRLPPRLFARVAAALDHMTLNPSAGVVRWDWERMEMIFPSEEE